MKQIKIFIPILPLLLFILSCSDDEPLSTPLNGQLLYTSPVNLPTDTFALGKQQVWIKDTVTGEIIDLVTDTAGKFYLPGWSRGRMFDIQTSFEHTDADEYQVVYTARTIKGGSDLKEVIILAVPDT